MIAKLTNDYIKQLINFILDCDALFPIPISHKTNISEYVEKVLSNGIVFAYMIDGEIAGVVLGYANDIQTNIAYLSLLCVKPEFQNKGIAKKLVEQFKEYCSEAGMKRITLYTHVTNTKAIELYKKHGFVMGKSNRAEDYFLIYTIEGCEEK